MLFVYRFHCFLIKFVSLVLKKSLYHLSNEKKKGLTEGTHIISSGGLVLCLQQGWTQVEPKGPGLPGSNFFLIFIIYFNFVVGPSFFSISLVSLIQIATIQPKNLTKTIKIWENDMSTIFSQQILSGRLLLVVIVGAKK